jgi:predicted transcriptional regulator
MQCTNLSNYALNQAMEPLISQGLLIEVEDIWEKEHGDLYKVTEKGKQFIQYLGMALSLVEL